MGGLAHPPWAAAVRSKAGAAVLSAPARPTRRARSRRLRRQSPGMALPAASGGECREALRSCASSVRFLQDLSDKLDSSCKKVLRLCKSRAETAVRASTS